jgi:hypothetical protein
MANAAAGKRGLTLRIIQREQPNFECKRRQIVCQILRQESQPASEN